jgi:hypothetical protein
MVPLATGRGFDTEIADVDRNPELTIAPILARFANSRRNRDVQAPASKCFQEVRNGLRIA